VAITRKWLPAGSSLKFVIFGLRFVMSAFAKATVDGFDLKIIINIPISSTTILF
jgi:hypothetical protein